jgi:hypothetical protein
MGRIKFAIALAFAGITLPGPTPGLSNRIDVFEIAISQRTR